MPELPEVETVRRSLERLYLNKTIDFVEVLLPRMILSPLEEFKENLKGAKFISFNRKGKYLIINFNNGYSLISHLRMEGKYLIHYQDEPLSGHPRVIFHLKENEDIIYDDSRSFGIMILVKTNEVDDLKELKKLGPEPFFIDDPQYLLDQYKNKNTEIKTCLLDQEIMTGLGNIYCDEVLFKAKINPFKPAKKVTLKECEDILKYSKETLTHAIELGGSTVSSYHPEKGVDGKFQNELLCYGKEGLPCPHCGTKLLKDKLNGRGTTYCPKCQKVALSFGVTGKIASGKSTFLKYVKELGYKVFSSDEEVSRLYSLTSTKKGLIDIFGEQVLNDNLTISKGFIKQAIVNDPSKKKELEDFIHPLVKKSINEFLKKNKQEQFVFVEVPLMFETRFNLLFDYIIGITCSYATQLSHLKIRGSKSISLDMMVSQSNAFDKNVGKCDFLIDNDGDEKDLQKQVDKILSTIY